MLPLPNRFYKWCHILGGIDNRGKRQNLEADSGAKAFSLPYTREAITMIPHRSLHFAVQGPGFQYVHDGANLQKICVPVSTYLLIITNVLLRAMKD
jgi:hypothetical protein